MQKFPFTIEKEVIRIEGFPDAIKALKIGGPKAQRLAHIAMHRSDLDFALECLNAVSQVDEKPAILRQSLWRSAIVHFVKCFGKSRSRFGLKPEKVYKGDTQALDAFRYFKSLRDKHLVHDENSYALGLPTAVLNKRSENQKINQVLCLDLSIETLGQGNYEKLHLLVTRLQMWVNDSFDGLCDQLKSELEQKPYDELLSMDDVVYTIPTADDAHKTKP